MMKEDGGQAFPHGDPTHGGDIGMTLRDWFAGQAMLNHPMNMHEKEKIASYAYQLADAMLEARK